MKTAPIALHKLRALHKSEHKFRPGKLQSKLRLIVQVQKDAKRSHFFNISAIVFISQQQKNARFCCVSNVISKRHKHFTVVFD